MSFLSSLLPGPPPGEPTLGDLLDAALAIERAEGWFLAEAADGAAAAFSVDVGDEAFLFAGEAVWTERGPVDLDLLIEYETASGALVSIRAATYFGTWALISIDGLRVGKLHGRQTPLRELGHHEPRLAELVVRPFAALREANEVRLALASRAAFGPLSPDEPIDTTGYALGLSRL